MKRPALLLAAALAIGSSSPSRAVDTPGTDLWLVTSASVTSGSARFVTSLRILNPGSAAANVALRFLPQTELDGGVALGDNTTGPTATVPVASGATVAIEDVISAKFGGLAKAGGIRITSDLPVVVMSQTLNMNGQSSTGVPGTYGFAIPAQTVDDAVGVGETAWVPYVAGSASSASGYRTNLFLLSGNAFSNTSVKVELLRADGSSVGESDLQLGKLSQTQVNGVASLFGSSDANLTAAVTVTSGGPVFLGASVIDNAISSILYTPLAKSWHPLNAAFGLVLSDGGYDFPGRLDVAEGLPVYLSAGLVLDSCPGSARPLVFFVQMGNNYGNGAFTPNPDGTFTISGTMSASDGSVAATVGGTVAFAVDGSLSGQIVYARATSPGTQCPGGIKTFPYVGRKVTGNP